MNAKPGVIKLKKPCFMLMSDFVFVFVLHHILFGRHSFEMDSLSLKGQCHLKGAVTRPTQLHLITTIILDEYD